MIPKGLQEYNFFSTLAKKCGGPKKLLNLVFDAGYKLGYKIGFNKGVNSVIKSLAKEIKK